MTRILKIAACCVILVFVYACAYRHYLGLHGPSIRAYPDIHQNVTEDPDCLDCHHPDRDTEGPATSHPDFTGCLKCHSG